MTFNFLKRKGKRIHLDYASATPIHRHVQEAMIPFLRASWANPSAVYAEGVQVQTVIEAERLALARSLHVRQEDITFTSGGTEANNLALRGVVDFLKKTCSLGDVEILTTAIEHPSILETLECLKKEGVTITNVPVDETGCIKIEAFKQLLNSRVKLCTFAYVNSEIGVIQDLKKITRIVRKWNEENEGKIVVHTDACQAPLWLPCALDALGVDLMTLDAGKCYGPKGVGVLVHRHWVSLSPTTHGGGQERGLRSGTESVLLIVGCVRALLWAQEGYESRSFAVAKLRDHLIKLLREKIPNAVLNGSEEWRVVNNVNISLPSFDTEYATLYLDAKGIAVSTKSACGVGEGNGSYVVREISHDENRALSTLRFTLGEETKKSELDLVVRTLCEYIKLMTPKTGERE